jgi:hypothetical protein
VDVAPDCWLGFGQGGLESYWLVPTGEQPSIA